MKDKQPFNPLRLPADLRLEEAATTPQPNGQPAAKPSAGRQARTKTKGKSTRPRQPRPGNPRMNKKVKMSWEQLKSRLQNRLGQIDKAKLKRVLLACGIAAAIVAAVILAIKLAPVSVLLLAMLGLTALFRLWGTLPRSI